MAENEASYQPYDVALLAEGVDRNIRLCAFRLATKTSPSSRRAWIEMLSMGSGDLPAAVALLAEGVDRNINTVQNPETLKESPSSRRAWIEISTGLHSRCV